MLMQGDGQINQGVLSRDRTCQAQLTTVKLLLQQASTAESELKQTFTNQTEPDNQNVLVVFWQECHNIVNKSALCVTSNLEAKL